jgi:hypothetical protein
MRLHKHGLSVPAFYSAFSPLVLLEGLATGSAEKPPSQHVKGHEEDQICCAPHEEAATHSPIQVTVQRSGKITCGQDTAGRNKRFALPRKTCRITHARW